MGLELDELDLAPPGKPPVGQAVPMQYGPTADEGDVMG